ncbi:hypothetical protein [Candidatus Poriferisodalis sp.]|uniref:hypothetical protein n=1 Tax=Candidatus Poriferisodalis sp. TaxID=3101277 RepID=UPI003B5B4D30
MRFQGAVIEEQGITFGILVVKRQVLNSASQRDEAQTQASRLFGGVPTVLMAQDHQGVPEYYGRRDIVNFMANVPLSAVPWKEYTI